MKRILAIIGVVLLVGLYISTLIFAVIGSPLAISMFKASITLTIIVPVLLFGYKLIYKVLKENSPYAKASKKADEAANDETADSPEEEKAE